MGVNLVNDYQIGSCKPCVAMRPDLQYADVDNDQSLGFEFDVNRRLSVVILMENCLVEGAVRHAR